MGVKNRIKVIGALNRNIAKIDGNIRNGMILAGNFVKLKSQETTPVDEGNLKASHYTAPATQGRRPIVEIGATAEYAVRVHEDLAIPHFNPPQARAKFLELAIVENTRHILRIIQRRAIIR